MRLIRIYIIIFCLTFFGCQDQEKEIRYYPSKKVYNESELIKINLDTTSFNFKGITDRVYQIHQMNKSILIEIDDYQVSKKIIPLMFTEIRKRDVLSITSDSILIEGGYSISKLKPIMKRHYTNNNKNDRYPRSYKRAIIEVALDTSKVGLDLKETLLNLTRTFDEINAEVRDTLELKIFFSYFRHIPPPPLPIEYKK